MSCNMPHKTSDATNEERALDAETRASQWLADGNAAKESGRMAKAERCYHKSQFWLDKANLYSGRGEQLPPKR
jgi:hypothetical protein